MRTLISLFPLAFVLLSAGCDAIQSGNCTAEAEPAIEVEVIDAATGEPAAEGATGVVTEGAYSDSLIVIGINADNQEFLLGGAYERTGTYDVRVEKEGYQTWTREGVRVRGDDCGPRTVRLTAQLEQD
ncbi:MAG: hypothetical protein ABJF88_11525 [Rhodothermales bacterium]